MPHQNDQWIFRDHFESSWQSYVKKFSTIETGISSPRNAVAPARAIAAFVLDGRHVEINILIGNTVYSRMGGVHLLRDHFQGMQIDTTTEDLCGILLQNEFLYLVVSISQTDNRSVFNNTSLFPQAFSTSAPSVWSYPTLVIIATLASAMFVAS